MNEFFFYFGRISHVAAKEGHMLDVLSYIHIEKRTPVGPILLNVSYLNFEFTESLMRLVSNLSRPFLA